MSKKSRFFIFDYVMDINMREGKVPFNARIEKRYEEDKKRIIEKYDLYEETYFPELNIRLDPSQYTNSKTLAFIPSKPDFYKNRDNNWVYRNDYIIRSPINVNICAMIDILSRLITDQMIDELTETELEDIIVEFFRLNILHELVHFAQMMECMYEIELPKIFNYVENKNVLRRQIKQSLAYEFNNFMIEYMCVSDWYEIVQEDYEEKLTRMYYLVLGLNYLMNLTGTNKNNFETIYSNSLSTEDLIAYFEGVHLNKLEITDEDLLNLLEYVVDFKIKVNNYLRNAKSYIMNEKSKKYYPYSEYENLISKTIEDINEQESKYPRVFSNERYE